MSSAKGNSEVDFDFFDDPPDSPKSSKNLKSKSVSPQPEKRSVSPGSHRSRSRSPEDTYRSRSRSRSYSSRSRSRSRSSERRSRSPSYSDDYSDDDKDKSPRSGRSRSRSLSPQSDRHSKNGISVSVKSAGKSRAKEYFSDASADSDVTDVSPLNSPPTERKAKQFKPVHERPPSGGRRRPTSAKSTNSDYSHEQVHQDDDSLNMKLLMEVLELEQDDPQRQEQLARARKVLFVPPKAKAHDKKNYSFSNDQVNMIDRENQRLMEKIMRCNNESNTAKQRTVPKTYKKKSKPVMTSSALNRQRQQQKIEQENLALLRRLQTTRATKNLRRDHLLHDYQGKLIAGQSVAAAHTGYRSQSRTYTPSQYDDGYGMADMTEPATVVLNGSGRRSRPTSASTVRSNVSTGYRPASGRVRPQSAKMG